MQTDFVLFSPAHFAILAAVPLAAGVLARGAKRAPASARPLRLALGWFLLINELIWWTCKLSTEGVRAPEGLPLQLCDLALWLTVWAALRGGQRVSELAYFFGVGASAQPLITPELWAPALSYPTAYFFLAHGGIVVTNLYLVWAGLERPRPRAWWRALAVLNLFGLGVGAFNAVFETNYMYLCRKPASDTLLNHFGPWPIYLIAGEAFALVIFAALQWPYRQIRYAGNNRGRT